MLGAILYWASLFSIILSILPLSTSQKDDPCQIVRGDGRGILAMGELSDSIMIITSDYYVANLAKESSMQQMVNKFNLSGAEFTQLETAYPEFGKNEKFQKIKPKIFSGFIHSGDRQTVDMSMNVKLDGDTGVRYDIDKNEFIADRGYENQTSYYHFLTTAGSPDYYGLTRVGDKSYVSYWLETGDQMSKLYELKLCTNATKERVNTAYIAWEGTEKCMVDYDFSGYRGFVKEEKVYLFRDTNDVMFFTVKLFKELKQKYEDEDHGAIRPPDDRVMGRKRKLYEMNTVKFDDYFDCSPQYPARNVAFGDPRRPTSGSSTVISSKSEPSWSLYIIIAGIIILLMLIATCWILQRKSRHKGEHHSNKSSFPVVSGIENIIKTSDQSHKSKKSRKSHKSSDSKKSKERSKERSKEKSKSSKKSKSSRRKPKSKNGSKKSHRKFKTLRTDLDDKTKFYMIGDFAKK